MIRKVVKSITIWGAVSIICLALLPVRQTFAANNLNIKTGENDYKSTLDPGYYDSITIDASKVYEKGLADGKANADVITKVNSITVDPGRQGKFVTDGSSEAKTFTDSNMDRFTLAVIPKTSWHTFSKWNITFKGADLVYTAAWNTVSRTYYNETSIPLDATGIYMLGANGGKGGTLGGNGASLSGKFRLESGGELKCVIDAGKVGGGGGYTGFYYRRPGSGAFYPLLIAGGGSDGYHIAGGYDGIANNHLTPYIHNGSPRDFYGYASDYCDQISAYDSGAMSPSLSKDMDNRDAYGEFYGASFDESMGQYCTQNYDTFNGGAGWRGGKNGLKYHWEHTLADGTCEGMNTIWYKPTAGTSHYITSSEASAWGLSDVCAPLYSSVVFQGGHSGTACATVEYIAEN